MNLVRIFAVLFGGYLAVQMLVSRSWQLRYFRATRSLEAPGRLVGWWPLPALSERQFVIASDLMVLGIVLGLAGLRAGFLLAAVASLVCFSQIRLLDTVQRKVNLLPLVLILLASTPASVSDWFTPADPAALVLTQALLALVYVNSGITKLRTAGFGWMRGRALQAYLFEADLRYDLPSARKLAEKPSWCAALSGAVLVFECLGWLVLLIPGGGYAFALCALAFHLGTLVFMRVNFLKYHGAVFLVFAAAPVARVIQVIVGAP